MVRHCHLPASLNCLLNRYSLLGLFFALLLFESVRRSLEGLIFRSGEAILLVTKLRVFLDGMSSIGVSTRLLISGRIEGASYYV